MRITRWILSVLLIMGTTTFLLSQADAALSLLNNVPDWQQPYDTYVPPGPDPNPALPNNPYDNYCSPTAASNLFGYWEDVKGFTGITDRQAFPASPGWPAGAGWQQGLWHDGVIELGWHMDTNDVNPGILPIDGHLGTKLNQIAPGMAAYGAGAWVDPNPGNINKVGYPTNAWSVNWGNLGAATPWTDYIADINNGVPVLIDFDYWNPIVNPAPPPGYAQLSFYDWGDHPGTSLGHTVTGVGYLDINGIPGTGDEYWIVHDNWSSTAKTMALPYLWASQMAYNWQQNDHVNVIPEPGTLVLLGSGLLGIIGFVRRRCTA